MSMKGQIVIPKEIRERFGIHLSDTLIFKIQDIFFLVYRFILIVSRI